MSIFKKSAEQWTDFLPASRATDPATSHKAEAEINLGPRQKQCYQVLELVSWKTNATAGELSVHMWRNRDMFDDASFRTCADAPRKRLNDLEAMGLVERGATRKCTDSGKECVTWHITDKGRRELG